jgi:hypothetical protein
MSDRLCTFFDDAGFTPDLDAALGRIIDQKQMHLGLSARFPMVMYCQRRSNRGRMAIC